MGFNKKRFFALIGCNEDDDISIVKKAYRELVKEYHPDILRGAGVNVNIINNAKYSFNELQVSYENLVNEFKNQQKI